VAAGSKFAAVAGGANNRRADMATTEIDALIERVLDESGCRGPIRTSDCQ
jgi:hypothetical protein